MMNVIALSLMLASMAFAGIWSPTPEAGGAVGQVGGEQVIMKGGHRAVVVEYADDTGQGNTKVSISPPLASASLEEQLSSATAAVAGVAQDTKKAAMEAVAPEEGHGRGPRELICDAFGKCRYKITGAVYKAKDKVSDTAQEMEEGAKETVDSVIHKAKDVSSKATHAAEQGTDKAKRSVSRAKEAAEDTAEELKQKGRATMDKAGEAVSRAKESAEHTIDKAGEAADKAKKKGKETTMELSDIAKRGKEVLYDAVSCLIPKEFFKSLMSLIHLLGFATAYGTATWVTFVMSHLLARSLPRQQFGVVQSRVYPVYFKALASSVGLALLGHLVGRSRQPEVSSVAWRLQVYNLVGSIALVLVNLFFLEPRATKVMCERMKIEKEEGRGVSVQATRLVDHDAPLSTATTTTTTTHRREDGGETKSKMERLNRRLKKLNSYSSLLNVMTLMGLTWHLVYLSQRLCV